MSKFQFKFKSIGDKIIHLQAQDAAQLAQAMIRIQEHYESPFDDIRGKIFTLGQIKAKGSRSAPGVNTYGGGIHFDCDWSGYNVPSYVFEPFIKGLFDPLTEYEKDIVEVVRYRGDKFYFIATFGDDDPKETLEHEIRHAMYYISPEYKKAVDFILKDYKLAPLKACLSQWGYADEVLDDECHAYMGPDYDWFYAKKKEDILKYEIPKYPGLSERLNGAAEKFKKELGL